MLNMSRAFMPARRPYRALGWRPETVALWQIDKPMKSETGHSTQKPFECMKRPIDYPEEASDLRGAPSLD